MNEQITILNVDDKEFNRYTRGRVLRAAGYHVVDASSGTDALRLVAELKPALVLLDVRMPDISGFEVCRQIKSDPALESVFVLQISASVSESTGRVLALEGGADSYLSDPLEPAELLATVNALLRLQRAEVRLRESEERMRLALRAGKGGTWDIDLKTGSAYWSEDHFTILGIEPDPDGRGSFETWRRALHPHDAERVVALWEQAQREQKAFEDEYRITRTDTGEVRWLLAVGQFFYDSDGRPARGVGVFFDVTGRKLAEEKLRESERQLNQLADSMPQLVWIADSDGRVRYYNRRVREYSGFEQTEDGTWKWQGVLHPDDVQATSEAWQQALQNKSTYAREHRVRMKDGEFRWHLSRGVPSLDDDGNIISWYGTATDIHEVKLAEEELRYQLSLTRTITENTQSCLWMMDENGRCTFANPTSEQITGYKPEELVGAYLHEKVHYIRPDGAHFPKEDCPLYKALPLKEPLVGHEDVFVHKDGHFYPVRCSGRPILKDGVTVGTVIEILDITEEKRLTRERETLLEQEQLLRNQAEEANRLKDEFLATVGHEIRSPLNSILGWATIVRESSYDPETMRQAFKVVERSARAQKQIISDILDVSRIVSGKLNLDVRPLDLVQTIRAAIDTVRPAVSAKRIRLETRLGSDPALVTGDTDRLQQIFWNLLSNAAKFTPEEGEISIELVNRDGHAEVAVRDNGSGIEPDFLPYVFDRFRQADGNTNRRHSGLGLGLAIVKSLVELHGGTIEAQSEGEGQGAVFTVRLPLRRQETAAGDDETAAAPRANPDEDSSGPGGPRGVLGGLKILVVDDESDALELVNFVLREQGAEVFLADSVDRALQIIEEESLHVLISDIGMPDKDGYEFIRQVSGRLSGRDQPIPTIALTGYAREEDQRRTLQAGFHAYLAKPLEPAELVEKIFELVFANEA